MKLTPGQKAARKAVMAAARAIIKEVDAMDWRKECVEFSADFHLGCDRFDKGTYLGNPMRSGMPVYCRAIAAVE